MAEGQHLADARGGRLLDPLGEDRHGVWFFGIDGREHHHRLETEVAAAVAEGLGLLGRSVFRHHRHRLAGSFGMLRAPGHKPVAGRGDAGKRPLQRKCTVDNRHAGVLEDGGLAAGRGGRRVGRGGEPRRRHRRRGGTEEATAGGQRLGIASHVLSPGGA